MRQALQGSCGIACSVAAGMLTSLGKDLPDEPPVTRESTGLRLGDFLFTNSCDDWFTVHILAMLQILPGIGAKRKLSNNPQTFYAQQPRLVRFPSMVKADAPQPRHSSAGSASAASVPSLRCSCPNRGRHLALSGKANKNCLERVAP